MTDDTHDVTNEEAADTMIEMAYEARQGAAAARGEVEGASDRAYSLKRAIDQLDSAITDAQQQIETASGILHEHTGGHSSTNTAQTIGAELDVAYEHIEDGVLEPLEYLEEAAQELDMDGDGATEVGTAALDGVRYRVLLEPVEAVDTDDLDAVESE